MESAKLTKHLVDKLKNRGEEETFKLGSTIIEEGKESDKIYIVEKGYANIFKKDPIGNEVLVGTAGPGSVLGEMGIFMDTDRTATVKAVSDVKTISFTKEEFLNVISEIPEVAYYIINVLVKRLSSLNEKLINALNSKLIIVIGNYILDVAEKLNKGNTQNVSLLLDLPAVSFETGIDQEKILITILNLKKAGILENLNMEELTDEESGTRKTKVEFYFNISRMKSYLRTVSVINL